MAIIDGGGRIDRGNVVYTINELEEITHIKITAESAPLNLRLVQSGEVEYIYLSSGDIKEFDVDENTGWAIWQ